MSALYEYAFQPVNSTAPGFNSSSTSTTTLAFESTVRSWQYPTSRVVRIASKAADDFFVNFGSTAVGASVTDGMLILGGTAEIFRVTSVQTNIGIASSTDVVINVTIGTGR